MSTEAETVESLAPLEAAPARSESLLYPWLVVVFLMVVYTSSFIDRTILGLLVKPIRADLRITDTEYSLLGGLAFVVMYSISGIPLGWVVDRWSRRAVIAIGVAFWSLMTAGCGLANSFWRLFGLRVGVGIGEATLSPATYSLVADIFPADKLSRALSVFGFGSSIGAGLALIIGGPVVDRFTAAGPVDLPVVGVLKPWQMVFMVIGLPGLILALLSMVIVPEPPRHSGRQGAGAESPSYAATLSYMWRSRAVYFTLFFGMGFIAMFAYGSNFWFPAFLQRIHGFTAGQTGLFLGTSILVLGILGALTAGWLSDRLIARGHSDGHFRVAIGYGIGNAVCALGIGLSPWPDLSLFFVAVYGFFSNTIIGIVAAAVQMITPGRMRGKVSALYIMTAAFIGLAFGPTAIGAANDYVFRGDQMVGYSIALVGFAFPLLGCLLLQAGRGPVLRHMKQF